MSRRLTKGPGSCLLARAVSTGQLFTRIELERFGNGTWTVTAGEYEANSDAPVAAADDLSRRAPARGEDDAQDDEADDGDDLDQAEPELSPSEARISTARSQASRGAVPRSRRCTRGRREQVSDRPPVSRPQPDTLRLRRGACAPAVERLAANGGRQEREGEREGTHYILEPAMLIATAPTPVTVIHTAGFVDLSQ